MSQAIGHGHGDRAGQTVAEYAVLAAVVVAALLSMQIYLKRGVSGKIREAADSIGEQYAPRATTSDFSLTLDSVTTTEVRLQKDRTLENGEKADVIRTTTTIERDTTTRTGSETVGALGTDLWN